MLEDNTNYNKLEQMRFSSLLNICPGLRNI